jgi:DNA-binding beta-propeller fold protein YncE
MYAIGRNERTVFAYTLTTAWDISTASLDLPTEGYFSVAAQETNPTDLFFKPDGTKMYILGYSGDEVNEYDLNTAWEVSSASYVQNFSVTTEEASPEGIFFKPDGTKMYITGSSGDEVNEYTLSSAWDISTASYVQNFSVATETPSPRNVFFKPDGTRMYICAFEQGAVLSKILEYSLSSAWDISTASLTTNLNYSSIYPAYEAQPSALAFNADGTKMYVAGSNRDTVVEYTLGTPWSISTASKASAIIFSVVSEESTPWGLFFGDNGTKMYIVGLGSDAVWQYTTGTYGDATLTYPSSVKFPSGTAPAAPADGETDILEFSTMNGGTTWYGVRTGDAMA